MRRTKQPSPGALRQQGHADRRAGKQRQQFDSCWKQDAYNLGYNNPMSQTGDGPDARLIASAPDLLETLQDLLDAANGKGNTWDAMNNARTAIKRATGKPHDDDESICRHCGRAIIQLNNRTWVDPQASGDDIIWRETCDQHDTFAAEHEPEEA